MKTNKLFTLAAVGLSIYLISTGLSFALFTFLQPKPKPTATPSTSATPGAKGGFVVDPGAPRNEVCPLNGVKYTKAEKELWEKHRPLAVMIENHEESRPQSGLSSADVVYESVAEGGITRFMGVFYCNVANPVALAPVRSARIYFLPWVLEYDALYNHVGGAGRCNDPTVDNRAKALCRIEEWKIKDMDQFGISFPTCYRNYDRLDHTVATEHTMVCFTDKLFKLAAERDWTNVDTKGVSWDKNFRPWKFKDEAGAMGRGSVQSISFVAWKGYEDNYGVKWQYDTGSNSYKRSTGGEPHMDLETKSQLTAKVVAVLFAKETGPVDDHMHLLYDNMGSGDGLVFQDGKVTEAIWKKADKSSRTIFYSKEGKEIEFNPGQIWIEMLPKGTVVTY